MHWDEVSAQGVIYSLTIVRQPAPEQFPTDNPQALAIVELDAGPRVPTWLVTEDPIGVRIGDRVRGVFDQIDAHHTLLRFVVDQNQRPGP